MSDPGLSGEMLIGELAEATGVGVETLRSYEREELLPEPPRTAAGYRQVQRDAVRRVQFILKAKELGFTLVAAKARAKVEVVDSRIRELRRVRRVLDDLIAACAANEETGECPILDALEQEPKSSDQGA